MKTNELNYEGLTKDQIEIFIESIQIDVEVDSYYSVCPTLEHGIVDSEYIPIQETGWMSGTILGYEFGEYIKATPSEFVKRALELYKEKDANLEDAYSLLKEEFDF